jgi:electron transfer flavoprotein alpha subunit
MRRVTADELGDGPWGQAGSPTTVGITRALHHDRVGKVLSGDVVIQVAEAAELLAARGVLLPSSGPRGTGIGTVADPRAPAEVDQLRDPVIAVIVEAGRPRVGAELLGEAARLSGAIGARVHALAFDGDDLSTLGSMGADEVTHFTGPAIAEDVADAVVQWSAPHRLWAVLGPSTAFGREVLGRLAAALGAGLVGDAIGLEVAEGELVSAKPAFSGAMVADITCSSDVHLVSVRPGVLPLPHHREHVAPSSNWPLVPRGRLRVVSLQRDDDVEVLARAEVVIGVGSAVLPDEYQQLSPLAALLGAELAATRKVTDNGWAPRSRQVGITGRSIAPRLYVALGSSGKFNHMVGARAAGTILAINHDPEAPVFHHCDVGIVGDWHAVVPALTAALSRVADR